MHELNFCRHRTSIFINQRYWEAFVQDLLLAERFKKVLNEYAVLAQFRIILRLFYQRVPDNNSFDVTRSDSVSYGPEERLSLLIVALHNCQCPVGSRLSQISV